MKTTPVPPSPDPIVQTAAEWVLKHDRGLTAAEQDRFSLWLAADQRHGAAFAEQRWGWEELDRLAGVQTTVHAVPNPDLLAPPRRGWRAPVVRFGLLPLAAAAAVAIVFWAMRPAAPAEVPAPSLAALAAPIEQRTLEDGTVVLLNRGAELTVDYTPATRRVALERGEAAFQVAKNPARPFLVGAGPVSVRAVGTVFNVRLSTAAVEVLVTEGKVAVLNQAASASSTAVEPPEVYLTANQRSLFPLAATDAPRVATLTEAEIETRLAWQPRLMDFTDAPLPDIVAEFNRRNPVRLTLGDAALGEMRLSATFRSDNVEGFVRLMESDFGMRAEWRDGGIVLRKAR